MTHLKIIHHLQMTVHVPDRSLYAIPERIVIDGETVRSHASLACSSLLHDMAIDGI